MEEALQESRSDMNGWMTRLTYSLANHSDAFPNM
jgi:hypothetical protein